MHVLGSTARFGDSPLRMPVPLLPLARLTASQHAPPRRHNPLQLADRPGGCVYTMPDLLGAGRRNLIDPNTMRLQRLRRCRKVNLKNPLQFMKPSAGCERICRDNSQHFAASESGPCRCF